MSTSDSDNNAGENTRFPSLSVALPGWVEQTLPPPGHRFTSDLERMKLVIDLARTNVEHGGGPFGAAVFEKATGALVAPGVNVVVSSKWSGAHAEMVALAIAQQAMQSHDLNAASSDGCELFTSCEPCSMCFGATPWSGVTRLVCAAREEDAQAIGFDEGPKPTNWVETLETRGIQVVQDILRDQARAVLGDYDRQGGPIYNSRIGE